MSDERGDSTFYYDRRRKIYLTPCHDWLVIRRSVAEAVLTSDRVRQIFGEDEGDGLPLFYQVGVNQGLAEGDIALLESVGGLLPVFLYADGTPVAIQPKILVSAGQEGRDKVSEYIDDHSVPDVMAFRQHQEGMYLVMVSGDARRTLALANAICEATGVSATPSFISIRTVR